MLTLNVIDMVIFINPLVLNFKIARTTKDFLPQEYITLAAFGSIYEILTAHCFKHRAFFLPLILFLFGRHALIAF